MPEEGLTLLAGVTSTDSHLSSLVLSRHPVLNLVSVSFISSFLLFLGLALCHFSGIQSKANLGGLSSQNPIISTIFVLSFLLTI